MAKDPSKLTRKQEMFVREYLVDLNATQAAIRAGYASKRADAIGYELLRKPEIQAAIQNQMDDRANEVQVTAKKVLTELVCLAHYDPADIAKESITCPADICKLPEHVRRAIIGWGWDKLGNFTLKLAAKTPNLDLLGKHLKLFNEVGSKENPLHIDKLADEQLDARLKALESKG